MTTGTTRFTLTVPGEMAKRAETLKKDMFYDKLQERGAQNDRSA